MSNIEVRQLLHLGVVMGLIKDLKIIEMAYSNQTKEKESVLEKLLQP